MTSSRWVLPVVVASLVAGTGGAVAALAGRGARDPQPDTLVTVELAPATR